MKNVYLQFANECQNIASPVLATILRTTGSTPQKAGSSALFSASGLFAGTIGGGILEGKVMEIAIKAGKTKKSGFYSFLLDNSHGDGEDARCGGRTDVLVDANPGDNTAAFKCMQDSLDNGISGIMVTRMTGIFGDDLGEIAVNRHWISSVTHKCEDSWISESLFQMVRYAIEKDDRHDCRLVEHNESENDLRSFVFIEPVFPQPKLIIAGAGHVGKALSCLGQMLDFEVTVIDDRPEFANRQNIPGADRFIVDEPGKALSVIEKKPDCYFVIVTRGHKDDASALQPCLGSGAAYVGMIGSRTKIAKMRDEFISKGWATEQQWSEIYAPIGMEIGSQTVEEIAVSIAAQLVDVRNRANKSGKKK